MPTSDLPQAAPTPHPLTRKLFAELSVEMRAWAVELARLDPRHINLKECHRFNARLAELRLLEPLGAHLRDMKPARPVARWQVVTLTLVAWALVILLLMNRVERIWITLMLNGAVLTLLASYMVPASVFGTTVEGLEGKLLRIVTTLEVMLVENQLGLSEGAFFSVRENLEAARRELRQQLDLAHRE